MCLESSALKTSKEVVVTSPSCNIWSLFLMQVKTVWDKKIHNVWKSPVPLNPFHIQTLLKTPAADDFWKHNKHFLLLPQCFHLFSIKLFSIEIFYNFAEIFSKSSAADLIYVGKVWIMILRLMTYKKYIGLCLMFTL